MWILIYNDFQNKLFKSSEDDKLKKYFAIIMALGICFLAFGCQKEKTENLKFVTSCYPVYIMALNLTDSIDGVEVLNMTENHSGCLHDFQLQSEDLKQIEKSSAFIINGAGMESFMDKIIKESPNVKTIDSSVGIELIKDDDCDCEDEHCHHEYNPHIWVSVSNYIKQVENIAKGLANIDPAHSDRYKKNADIYTEKLNTLKNKMHSELSDIKNKDIITFHEAFPYFAKEFGLNIAGVISHEPDNDPNAKELMDIIEIVKKLSIKALFVEPQYPRDAANIVSHETGAKIHTLDPAATGDKSKDSYLNTMAKNLEVLKEALN